MGNPGGWGLQLQGVQGLGAVARGVPEVRRRDVQGLKKLRFDEGPALFIEGLAVGVPEPEGQGVAAGAEVPEVHRQGKLGGAGVDVFGVEIEPVDLVGLAEGQADGAVNAHGDEPGHPVPAVGTLNPPGVEPFRGKGGHAQGAALHLLHRGAEGDLQAVPAGLQQAVHGEGVGPEHVVAAAQDRAVEGHGAVDVQAVEFQKGVGGGGWDVEVAEEGEVAVFDPGAGSGVVPVEDVLEKPGPDEVGVDAPRHLRRDGELVSCRVPAAQRPFFVLHSVLLVKGMMGLKGSRGTACICGSKRPPRGIRIL